MSTGQPGQGHAALSQLDKGITLTAQGSSQTGHRVNKVAVTEVIWLQEETETHKRVDIVHDLSSWTEVRGSTQTSTNTNTDRGHGQVGLLE